MIKKLLVTWTLKASVAVFNWAADKAFNIIDTDNDGSISQAEFKFRLYDTAKIVDANSKKLYQRIKKK